MKYLLDTCIIISALRSKQGASYQLLRQAIQGQLPIVMDFKLLAEYKDVLTRSEILAALVFTATEIEMILTKLVMVAEESHVNFLWRPNLQDEGDNYLVVVLLLCSRVPLSRIILKTFTEHNCYFHML